MSQRYGGPGRRGRPQYHQYKMSPKGPPRDQHHVYRPPHERGPPAQQREGVYANPHLAHSLTSLLGSLVEVKLTNGIVYEGILSAVSPKLEVALKAANDKAKSATRDNVKQQLHFNFSEIVNVTAKEDRRQGDSDIFRTDTEISQSNGSTIARALQPFDFDEDSSKVEHLDSDSMGWSVDDMFQVNKEKFDVNSTYDAEMVQYTTKLERQDTDNFRQREARAHRIAQEIESKEKSRFGIDDIGTEEEMFSSVVRQEVAPPPETTPFRPNGGVPSIGNSKSETVTPPTSTTVGVNSIPKTDSGSTGSRDSKTELLLGEPTTAEATPTRLVDTPTLSSTSESSLGKDVDSSDVEKVTEVKQKHVSRESEDLASVKVQVSEDESGIVSIEERPSPVEPQAAADSDQSSLVKKAEELSANLVDKTSESVRKFKLDPNAKEFTPAGFSSLPATPIASPSSAVSSSSSSARSSTSTPYLGGKKPSYRQGGRQMRSQHQHMPGVSTVFQPGEVTTFIPSPPSVGQGSYVLQTPSFIRPGGLHTQPTSGQVFYTPVPQFPGPAGLIPPQPGMIPPQQLVAASPKFVTEIPAQPQVIGQPYPQTSQATHQFIPPPSQAALLQPAVSQTQMVQTPQGLVSAHQPVFNVVQGTLATGAGAAGAGGLVGGVTFHQYHHHQALAAAASTGQPGVGVATQPLAGAAVTPNRQLFQQSHQVGK